MVKFSANLGFLWTELPLVDAIQRAAEAGFDAVECHWPYDTAPEDVREVLEKTGLPMLGINTVKGKPGEFGLLALSGREAEARAAIDQAIAYAASIGAHGIHAMSGIASGEAARQTFVQNLTYATEKAAPHGITILIEPINSVDVPGYFMHRTADAAEIIAKIGAPNLKMMFDFYHLQIMEGDLTRLVQRLLPIIGHIQFASVPTRGAPDQGELDFSYIFKMLDDLGYDRPLGAEYRPLTTTEASLDWMKTLTRRI